ncbi:hypothetical protein [Candidatus Magnetominusculus dajiuhuensis]|uniref:hypothetical protein n=1 Tax=Candidatus Magnetominusculus dajiuhuensis TaxID=3137712 RepID=UPI003B431341
MDKKTLSIAYKYLVDVYEYGYKNMGMALKYCEEYVEISSGKYKERAINRCERLKIN